MQAETKDNLALVGKSILFVIGGILVVSAFLQLIVAGWETRAALYLLAGLVMMLPPLAFAFRDAVRQAHKGRR